MNGFWPSIVAIGTAIVSLAVVAVIFSPSAQTVGVIQAGGQAFSGSITAAVNPYSGGVTQQVGSLGGVLSNFGSAHI